MREGSTQRSRSTNYSTKQRTCQPLDDSPPPRHPPHNKTPTPTSRSAIVKIIANEEEIDDLEDRRGDSTKRPHSTSRTIQLRARRPLDDPPPRGQLSPARTATLRPDEFPNLIRNQNLSEGIEIDPRVHEHPADHAQIFQISRRRHHAGSSKLTFREQLEG